MHPVFVVYKRAPPWVHGQPLRSDLHIQARTSGSRIPGCSRRSSAFAHCSLRSCADGSIYPVPPYWIWTICLPAILHQMLTDPCLHPSMLAGFVCASVSSATSSAKLWQTRPKRQISECSGQRFMGSCFSILGLAYVLSSVCKSKVVHASRSGRLCIL